MNILKEPKGVIFTVENRDLTPEEKKLLGEFITDQRRKNRIQKAKVKNKKQGVIVKGRFAKV